MPSDSAVQFVDGVADRQIDAKEYHDENKDAFKARYLELLNDPDARLPGIEEKYVNYFRELSADSFGDPDLAAMYWSNILGALDQSFDELNSVPTDDRGNEFHTVRNIMSAASWEQAFIETGFADYSVRNGIIGGKINRAYAETDFNPADFKGGMSIKSAMNRKKNERVNR